MSTNLIDSLADETFETRELVSAEELVRIWREHRPETVAMDTESPTFHWDIADADPFAMTLSWGRENTYYVNVRDAEKMTYERTHFSDDPNNHRVREDAARAAHEIFCGTPRVVFHNSKYDLHVFKRMFDAWKLPLITRRVDDTMIMSPVLNELRYHGLKELCVDLEISYDGNESAADALRNQIDAWRISEKAAQGREIRFDEVPMYLMVPYAVRDAYMTWELYHFFDKQMDEMGLPQNKPPLERDLRRIYELEMKVMWVLFDAEERGIRIDLDFVNTQIAELYPVMAEIRREMASALGWELNPGSTDDVARALKQVGIQGDWTNRRTGKQRLPEWVLEGIDHPFAKRVLEYRTAQKMVGSYFEHLRDGYRLDSVGQAIIRCDTKQNGARTGRTSITRPALQTIPREKGNVRGAFIAREGHSLIFIDYEGQELSWLAHFLKKVGDDSMAKVLESGLDLHQEAASVIYKLPYADVSKHGENKWMRDNAKNVNFAIVYGAGQAKIAAMLGVSLEEGKAMLRSYYNRFPGIWTLKKQTEAKMLERKWIVTPFGRRHRETDGRYAYKSINSLIQGTSADANKAAMVKVTSAFKRNKMTAWVLLQIHDELMAEARDDCVKEAAIVMAEAMKDVPQAVVPFKVDISIAKRWSEAK